MSSLEQIHELDRRITEMMRERDKLAASIVVRPGSDLDGDCKFWHTREVKAPRCLGDGHYSCWECASLTTEKCENCGNRLRIGSDEPCGCPGEMEARDLIAVVNRRAAESPITASNQQVSR